MNCLWKNYVIENLWAEDWMEGIQTIGEITVPDIVCFVLCVCVSMNRETVFSME